MLTLVPSASPSQEESKRGRRKFRIMQLGESDVRGKAKNDVKKRECVSKETDKTCKSQYFKCVRD